MPIKPLNIFCYFNKQRFTQLGAMDAANFYGVAVPDTKKGQALYPAMGRKHVRLFNQNKLIFTAQPTKIFKSINRWFAVVGVQVFAINKFYEVSASLGEVAFQANIWNATLAVGTTVYTMISDETNLYVITENGSSVSMVQVTDPNAPGGATTGGSPLYVAAFGNRFVVSEKDTPNYYLSTINLDGNANTWFTISGAVLFNRASGVIGQFAVLHAQLYILCDFTTDVWSNIPTRIEVAGGGFREFPWKLNTSYNFDYGIADPFSLDVDFGRMCWLARNSNGLVTFMVSTGGQPEDMSSQAVNVLLERSTQDDGVTPFLTQSSNGFLYQYENSIFYRVVAGKFLDFGDLDIVDSANALEFNFNTKTWHRVIELNGERNRIQQHIFFNNKHLVTVEEDHVVYEMAGNIYFNELRTQDTEPQAENAFTKFPMRYELVTGQIFEEDYSEFLTDYVEIDFVFGDQSFYKSNAPFDNTVFIVDDASTEENPIYLETEDSTPGNPVFIITEDSNTPSEKDDHYNYLYKPSIELFVSDDGGVTFVTADVREFSPLGAYRWRMRWYQLGASRNRCYKLVCVSSAPIVILGAVQNVRRSSGGAN
jgi:hypothetical protein